MTTKLTLTIEDTVIDSAKKYARQKGKSLSDIVENYLTIYQCFRGICANIIAKGSQIDGVSKTS